MNDKIDMKPIILPPFKRFCVTVGELPSSYIESMSYYETLLWLCKYLSEKVIPAIDNNAEALREVQNLFVELQTYVNDYFDNLDVQEEINNKLDDMFEDGVLEEIIKNLLVDVNGALTCNLELRRGDEYIDGVSLNAVAGYVQGMTTTENTIIITCPLSEISTSTSNLTRLAEYNKSSKVLIREVTLELGHANSIAYNEADSEIYVAKHSYYDGLGILTESNDIIIIDYDTFNIKDVVTPTAQINKVRSVSYDNKNSVLALGFANDVYIMTDWQTIDEHITLKDNLTSKISNPSTGSGTYQNFILFDNHIYTTRMFPNGIVQYDLDGNVCKNYYNFDLDTPIEMMELQSIALEENGDLYIASTQTSTSDDYKYAFYDKTIFKTNLIHNGYKYDTLLMATTSSPSVYVDSTTTNNYQIGTSDAPFKYIQQAIMYAEYIKRNITVVINLVGSSNQYSFIVSKGTNPIVINGNNNFVYGLQCYNQKMRINNVRFNLSTLINITNDTYPANIYIRDSKDVTLASCSFINGDESQKDIGIYCERSSLELISGSFTNLTNAIHLYDSSLYVLSGMSVTDVDYYWFTRGNVEIHQPSGAIYNRTNPASSTFPCLVSITQSVNFTYSSGTLTLSNAKVDSAETGNNVYWLDCTLTMDGVTWYGHTFIMGAGMYGMSFINSGKTANYECNISVGHTANTGIWTLSPRFTKTVFATGTTTDITDSSSLNITTVRVSK